MRQLSSYSEGQWITGEARQQTALVNPTDEAVIACTSTAGIDRGLMLRYAREKGGEGLRRLSFSRRAELLGAMAASLHEHREELLDLSQENGGNTRSDAKFDIDGATGTLSYFAKVGAALEGGGLLPQGETLQLGRSKRLVGRHFLSPRRGVAVLINAFNFPAWGFAEKAACALLAGMPVVCKPATSTALPAHRMAQILVQADIMPAGSFSFLCGPAGDLLDHLEWQDVVAFTGSAATGAKIRCHPRILAENVPVNIEADSLNAAVLGKDLSRGDEAFDLFLREISRDISQKAGQKCTATRRILVSETAMAEVSAALTTELKQLKTGNPLYREVRIGPLATQEQIQDVRAGIARLLTESEALLGGGQRGDLTGLDESGDLAAGKGFFVSPTLLLARRSPAPALLHQLEVFGPCATLVAYDGTAESAAAAIGAGKGSLVSSIYSDDEIFVRALAHEAAPYLGRLHIGSSKVADHSPGPGTVLPMMMHGGPGRAGNGRELGGLAGLEFYMQKTGVQGFAPWLLALPD